MTEIHHLNCVKIILPGSEACGHCILIKEGTKLVLVDTGIGLADTLDPAGRIGQELIDAVGYRFGEDITAIRQIQQLGFDPRSVSDCIISHLDNDHIGGLADFPQATVHLSAEELQSYHSGNPRYLKTPMEHKPLLKTYAATDCDWFGFGARQVHTGLQIPVFLIPLFGHTAGHCGIALQNAGKWLFYVADAYYLKAELTQPDHPVHALAEIRAHDNALRLETLDKIRRLTREHPEIEVFGYHDIDEFNACKNNSGPAGLQE